jgi:hypothetical protein
MAKQSITMRLTPEMIEAIDRRASEQRRTRTNMVEVLLELALGERLPDNASVKKPRKSKEPK